MEGRTDQKRQLEPEPYHRQGRIPAQTTTAKLAAAVNTMEQRHLCNGTAPANSSPIYHILKLQLKENSQTPLFLSHKTRELILEDF